MSMDAKKYYELHNCVVARLPNRNWRVIVYQTCSALTEDNKCGLHGSDDKPQACRDLDEKTKHRFHITKGCLLE